MKIVIVDGSRDLERKTVAILQVLSESSGPLSSITVARELRARGLDVSDRTVRYHLRATDKHGLTRLLHRHGRTITPDGLDELRRSRIPEQVGFASERISRAAFQTSFDASRRVGRVAINTSLFPKKRFGQALEAMRETFAAGLCISSSVAVASEGEMLGDVLVPEGKVGLATICRATITGALLRAGIPMDARFGGVLEIRNSEPTRFVAIINFSDSSLSPSEVYIRARMTEVRDAATKGDGKILASFWEMPAIARPLAENTLSDLDEGLIHGVLCVGKASQPLCQIPAGLDEIGVVMLGGMNPIAAAHEAGIEAENFPESGTLDFERLMSFWEL